MQRLSQKGGLGGLLIPLLSLYTGDICCMLLSSLTPAFVPSSSKVSEIHGFFFPYLVVHNLP